MKQSFVCEKRLAQGGIALGSNHKTRWSDDKTHRGGGANNCPPVPILVSRSFLSNSLATTSEPSAKLIMKRRTVAHQAAEMVLAQLKQQDGGHGIRNLLRSV